MRVFKWLYKRFGTFDLLPEYFTAAGQQIQNVLWGALVPFLAWGIWFIVGTPPLWVNWTAVLVALFIAGYYVWRADHIRLAAGLVITGARIHYLPANDPAYPPDGGHSSFIQLLMKCQSESPVYECEGHIVRARQWNFNKSRWEEIPTSGPIKVRFSNGSLISVTQHPGTEYPLDTLFIDFKTRRIRPWSPNSINTDFGPASEGRALRFNIKLTCFDRVGGQLVSTKPVDSCIDIQFGGDPYTPNLELIEEIRAD